MTKVMIKTTLLKPTYKANIYQSDFPAKGSRLVYGTSGLGGVWGAVDESESIDCLLYAFENGITTLDTSPSYSKSEEYVGKALRRWQGEKPFISSKVGRLPAESAFDAKMDYSPMGMRNSLYRSLDLLGIECLDLLFLHEPQWVPLDKIDEILNTLQSFKAEGLTKMLGVGGNPSETFMPYIQKDIFQVVSGFCRLDACTLTAFDNELPCILERKLAYYAASSLHFSLLGNRFDTYTKTPPTNTEYISAYEITNAIEVNKIAQKHGISLPTLAQRYLFSINEATRIVMGARKINQIENTIDDWQQGALPEDIFDEITYVLLRSTPSVFD
jgi:aryl-alcohol dehydrogenase-like predicted oxidoreductase